MYHFYKSPFKLSDWNPHHPIQRLQQATRRTGVKLVLGSVDNPSGQLYAQVHTVLAAGGQSAQLPEPHAESLETDGPSLNYLA